MGNQLRSHVARLSVTVRDGTIITVPASVDTAQNATVLNYVIPTTGIKFSYLYRRSASRLHPKERP